MDVSHVSLEKPLPKKPLHRSETVEEYSQFQRACETQQIPSRSIKHGAGSQQSTWSNSTTTTFKDRHNSILIREHPNDIQKSHSSSKRACLSFLRHWWPQETASWVAGLACYAATAATLLAVDGHPIPQLRFGITLNALISILATLAVFFVMVPISAGLSQTKWVWFYERKPLLDFEVIESASRGPGGSLKLLLKRRGGYLAIVGAILTLLLVATGPFVQQVVEYERNVSVAQDAHLPISTIFNTTMLNSTTDNYIQSASVGTPDLKTKAAFFSGAMTSQVERFDVTPACPLGNCTWPPYQTLSFCSECKTVLWPEGLNADTTSGATDPSSGRLIWEQHLFRIWAFPARQTITSIYANMSLPTSEWRPNSAFDDYKGPILADLFILTTDDLPNPQNIMTMDECVLSMCVKTLQATYRNGIFNETELSTDLGPFQWPDEHQYLQSLGKLDQNIDGITAVLQDFQYNLTITPEHSNNTFTVIRDTLTVLITWLQTTLTCTDNVRTAHKDNGIIQAVAIAGSVIYHPETGKSTYKPYMVKEWVNNIAASMSRSLRMQPSNNLTAIGTSYSYGESVVRVRWVWMIYPFSVLVLGMTFYLSVLHATKGRRAPRWKDNSLGALLHGMTDHGRDAIRRRGYTDSGSVYDMECAAKNVRVKLKVGKDNYRHLSYEAD